MSTKKYTLGDKNFKTKKEMTEFVSNYVKHSVPGEKVLQKDRSWIIELLSKHPRFKEKSDKMTDIIVDKTSGVHHFALVLEGGHREDISFHKCLKPSLNTSEAQVKSAFRASIKGQIEIFRSEKFAAQNEIRCPVTGITLRDDADTHIDHDYTVLPFRTLLENFMKDTQLLPFALTMEHL